MSPPCFRRDIDCGNGCVLRTKLNTHPDPWDGRDNSGRPATGVYVYRVDADGARQQGRMLLVK